MKYLIAALIAGAIFITGIYVDNQLQPKSVQSFGSFTPLQGNTYTLAGAGVTNTSNTIQLSSFTLPDPNKTPINMNMFGAIGYGVIEPQTSKIENITFTGVTQNPNGTATLTGVARGISFYTPFAASTTLALSHAGGSNFILSNTAAFYGQQFAFYNNAGEFTAVQTFASTSQPQYDMTPATWSSQYSLVDKDYVDSGLLNGAATSTFSNQGLVQLATSIQMAAGTASSTNGSPLVLTSKFATSTPYSSGSNVVPVTGTNEKLSQLFLDLTQAFTWSGLNTFTNGLLSSASTTIAASDTTSHAFNLNGVPYAFPSLQGTANTTLNDNGSGTLSWGAPKAQKYVNATTTASLAGSNSTITVNAISFPSGTLTASSTVVIDGHMTCGGTSSTACNVIVKDNSSNQYVQTSGNAGSAGCTYPFHIVITATSTTANEASMAEAMTNCGTSLAAKDFSLSSATNFNLANVTGFTISAQAGVSNTASLDYFTVVVTP